MDIRNGLSAKFKNTQTINWLMKSYMAGTHHAISFANTPFQRLVSESCILQGTRAINIEGVFMKSKLLVIASVLSMCFAGAATAAEQKGMSGMSGMEGQKGMSGMSGMEGKK
jgi:hypothetical protein